MIPPVPPGGLWQVHTERSTEATRRGLGPESLEETLRHLAGRGDRRVTVWIGPAGPMVEIDPRAFLSPSTR